MAGLELVCRFKDLVAELWFDTQDTKGLPDQAAWNSLRGKDGSENTASVQETFR